MFAALGFGRLLTSLLYGIEPSDPVALLATIALLVGVAVIATLGPARKAAQVDPAITLRDA
jgi:ABC-type lipoprotein release transport system permease subunit